MTSGGSSECIWRGRLSSLIFHSNLMFSAFVVLMIVSSLCQLVRFTSPPSVNQSAPQALTPNSHRNDRITIRILLTVGLSDDSGHSAQLYFSLQTLHYTVNRARVTSQEWREH